MNTPNKNSTGKAASIIYALSCIGAIITFIVQNGKDTPILLKTFGIDSVAGIPVPQVSENEGKSKKTDEQQRGNDQQTHSKLDTIIGRLEKFSLPVKKMVKKERNVKIRKRKSKKQRLVRVPRVAPNSYPYQTKKSDEYGLDLLLVAHKMNWNEFRIFNPEIKRYEDIHWGVTILYFKSYIRHQVLPGEVLRVLSTKFGVPVAEIKRANNIQGIRVDQKDILNIPYPGVEEMMKATEAIPYSVR